MGSRILGKALLCAAAVLVSGCSWTQESAGDEMLFVRETANGAAIYLMSDDGRDVRRLVDGTSPRWSPDGSRFAYAVNDDGKTKRCGTSVWVMNADTGAKRRVVNVESGFLICALAWAPDGVRLVYEDGQHIVVLNTQTGASEVVSLDVVPPDTLDWSPNGRELAVSATVTSKLLEIRTGVERHISGEPAAGDTRWSPDGERIALARFSPLSARRLTRFIVVAAPDGGNDEQITRGAVDSGPAWSPDGKRIYFSRLPASEVDDDATQQREEIYTLDVETRSLRRLTRNDVVDRSPDVRPHDRSLPSVPEPAVGDVVVPNLVGRYVLLEDEKKRFRRLGLTLRPLDFLARDGVLTVVRDQVPRGGSKALRGSVVKIVGSELDYPYTTGIFSDRVWRTRPGCTDDPEQPRVEMYGDLVRRVLRRGMSRSRVVTLLGAPELSAHGWSDWALGRWAYSHAEPIDCIYLRVEFDRRGRATRFHQWPR